MVAVTVISPLELIRTKMQSVQLSYREVGHAIKSSVRNAGPMSMMRGLGPSLLRDMPFSGRYLCDMAVRKFLKKIFFFFAGSGKYFVAWECWNSVLEVRGSTWISFVQNRRDHNVNIFFTWCDSCVMWTDKISPEWVWERAWKSLKSCWMFSPRTGHPGVGAYVAYFL